MTVDVALWGVGAMAGRMARTVLDRPDARFVGAIDRDPAKVGRDLGEVLGLDARLGVAVTERPESALAGRPNIVLHATGSFLATVAPEIETAIAAGANVISIAEEMAWPWAADPAVAARLAERAEAAGVSVLGTGVNPGFVMDSLVLSLTGCCSRVDSLYVARINDLGDFGPSVMRTQGVGLTPEAFAAARAEGTVVGHVGFPQSVAMLADALGWPIDRVEEERHPILAETARATANVAVAPGRVAGCRHLARGIDADGRVRITLDHPQQVRPEVDGVETGDVIEISGEPAIRTRIAPEIPGGPATAALAVNTIPRVLAAPAGLITMADLPIPAATPTLSRRASR